MKTLVRAAVAALNDPDKSADEIVILASASNANVAEVTELVRSEELEMHGGISMAERFDIGFCVKRTRVAKEFWAMPVFIAIAARR